MLKLIRKKDQQPLTLNLVDIDKIVISDKFKYNNKDFKYFIGYKENSIFRLLWIILPEMSGYIKYFGNGGKNISLKIENDNILDKYNEIWNKTRKALNIKFHSKLVYEEKYIKTKVKIFSGVVNTIFPDDKVPKESNNCTWIAVICFDFFIKIDKDYPKFF